MTNSTDDINDHPLELTIKDSQRSNQMVCVVNSTMVKNNHISRFDPTSKHFILNFHLDSKWQCILSIYYYY